MRPCQRFARPSGGPPDSRARPQARDLISKLLVKEPSARMPLAEVASHKWIVAHCE